jgi:hypothetical protein
MFDGKRLLIVPALVVVALAMGAPPAFGATMTQDVQFSNVLIIGDCNGIPIAALMTGTLHSVMGFSTNPNGMTHSTMDFTVHATGVDQATGVNYVINDNSHQETNTRGVAQEQYMGTKMKMISQGPAPNLTDRITLHVVIDSNNNTKVEKASETITCK